MGLSEGMVIGKTLYSESMVGTSKSMVGHSESMVRPSESTVGPSESPGTSQNDN